MMALNLPILPPFLADTFELNPIEGVPTDEDVKEVHAVIRALEGLSSVPRLYDINLAMQLSQYLFHIQMTRYRDKYPIIVFPTKITHTPPQLPGHIPIKLNPVNGPPSDTELKNIQEALRQSETLANVPSMFDADLSMKLSQHLFNVQFERYIHYTACDSTSNQVSQTLRVASSNQILDGENLGQSDNRSEPTACQDFQCLSTELDSSNSSDRTQPLISIPLSVEAVPHSEHVDSSPVEHKCMDPLWKSGMEDTNKLLARVADRLDDMKRFMVGAQHGMAMAWNYEYGHHPLISAKGEPAMYWTDSKYWDFHISTVGSPDAVDSNLLAKYLRLHDIGHELFTDEGHWKLKSDKKVEAIALARAHAGPW